MPPQQGECRLSRWRNHCCTMLLAHTDDSGRTERSEEIVAEACDRLRRNDPTLTELRWCSRELFLRQQVPPLCRAMGGRAGVVAVLAEGPTNDQAVSEWRDMPVEERSGSPAEDLAIWRRFGHLQCYPDWERRLRKLVARAELQLAAPVRFGGSGRPIVFPADGFQEPRNPDGRVVAKVMVLDEMIPRAERKDQTAQEWEVAEWEASPLSRVSLFEPISGHQCARFLRRVAGALAGNTHLRRIDMRENRLIAAERWGSALPKRFLEMLARCRVEELLLEGCTGLSLDAQQRSSGMAVGARNAWDCVTRRMAWAKTALQRLASESLLVGDLAMDVIALVGKQVEPAFLAEFAHLTPRQVQFNASLRKQREQARRAVLARQLSAEERAAAEVARGRAAAEEVEAEALAQELARTESQIAALVEQRRGRLTEGEPPELEPEPQPEPEPEPEPEWCGVVE